MKFRIILPAVALVACVALVVPQQDSRQDEATKKIDVLTRALDVEKKRTTELERRLDRIDAWFQSMRAATATLDAAADEARKNGFEQAGPNAQSRSNVLDGLKDFAAEMTRAVPVPVASK